MLPMLAADDFPNDAMERARDDAARQRRALALARQPRHAHVSGGEQQRVAVARALAMQPALLLADEPTGNLDTKSAECVFDLIREVNRAQGTAVLFVTHNPASHGAATARSRSSTG